MSQCQMILDYIDQCGSISTMEAFVDLGVTRLAARIQEIEEQGIPIERIPETSLNRFNQKVHYTRYKRAV